MSCEVRGQWHYKIVRKKTSLSKGEAFVKTLCCLSEASSKRQA